MTDAGKREIDLVIVATIRPDILRITLNSFKHHFLGEFRVRAIVNVDPIGDAGHSQADIVAICEEYFADTISRTPETASFSAAVQWGWSQVESEFFFHLEDDWCLKRKVDVMRLMHAFEDREVVSVRLNVTRNSKFETDENGVVRTRGLSLNPSMFRTAYVKELLQGFDLARDPEKQFSGNTERPGFPRPKFVIYGSSSDGSIVIDTGKKWRKSIGFSKWDSTGVGTSTWAAGEMRGLQGVYLKMKYRLFLMYWSKLYCKHLTLF